MSTLAAAASHVQYGAHTSGNGDLIGYLRVLETGVMLPAGSGPAGSLEESPAGRSFAPI